VRKLLYILLGGLALVLLLQALPDIMRYMRLREM
jgi:hypothetical protein